MAAHLELRPAVRELLAARPLGVRIKDMATLLRVTEKTVAKATQQMRADGEIAFVGRGAGPTRWCLVENKALALADYNAIALERKRYQKQQSNLRQNERRRIKREGLDLPGLEVVEDLPPRRSFLDARQAPPLRPAGPVSVWALGRAA